MNINQLSTLDSLASGDLIPVWDTSNGGERSVSLSLLLSYVSANLSLSDLSVQYSAPSATGFSVTVADNTHLILTPVAGYAAGTIKLPESPSDRSIVTVNCTQSVGTLTVDGQGKTVTGAPTSLSANGFFTLKYDAVMGVWYRIA